MWRVQTKGESSIIKQPGIGQLDVRSLITGFNFELHNLIIGNDFAAFEVTKTSNVSSNSVSNTVDILFRKDMGGGGVGFYIKLNLFAKYLI